MRVLSTYGSRGDVEPLVGLAVRLRELGARVLMCAPDYAERLAEAGVPLVLVGQPVRPMVRGAELVAAQFGMVAAAAEGCDALVASGVMQDGVWR